MMEVEFLERERVAELHHIFSETGGRTLWENNRFIGERGVLLLLVFIRMGY